MIVRLHEILAVLKGVKSRTYARFTEIDKQTQKPEPFYGLVKTYRPKDEEGDKFPEERKKVTQVAETILREIASLRTEYFDLACTVDAANCNAKADVVLPDGRVLLKDVPATSLLFLEKELTDLRTFVSRLTTLDEAEDWTADPNSGLFRSSETVTHRTAKIQEPITLAPATEKHPAQVQLVPKDIVVGFWHLTRFSGALPVPRRTAILEKIDILLKAVKQARERANSAEAPKVSIGESIFAYLLG